MAMGTGITSSLDKQYKQALQAAYNLPMDQAVQKIMSIQSLPEIVRLSAVKEIQSMNQGAQGQAPQGTVKDKILSAAAPPQQGMSQGMPPMSEGMPQGMPPMPEGMPPMPPAMADGGYVNDLGVASLSGERGDQYALDQGLGSLSANIDYAGGGIVSFSEGGDPASRRILERGLDLPGFRIPSNYEYEEGLTPEEFRSRLKQYGDTGELGQAIVNDRIAKGFSGDFFGKEPIPLARALAEPEMGSREYGYAVQTMLDKVKKRELETNPPKPASIEEKEPSSEELMLKLQGLYGGAPAGVGRVSIPRVGEEYPAAMQIERTPEFDLEQRLAQEAQADKAYGVNRNLLAEQQAALNKDIEALQGRAKQATWSSLGKRAAQAWDVQPGQAAPTLMGGLANLFGGMTEDIEAENRAVREEKQELMRYQRELARADNLERKGRAEEAQKVRTANELTRRGEVNKQRELNAAREMGLFTTNRDAAMKEAALNTQIDLANAAQRGAYDRARLSALASAKEKDYELQKLILDAAKPGRTNAETMNKIRENIASDPSTREKAMAMLESRGDEPTEQNLAKMMDLIINEEFARLTSAIISSQENQTKRMMGMAGLKYDSELDAGGL